ncbi:MAG TPA: hypothetical protein VJZ93_02350 [Candidatus Nanoarchaeia archaeon]|nr:hypothetical protein [Candidatus Nanoarchaeia archaeon]
MLPIKRSFLKKGIVIDIEEVNRLLLDNGCHNYRDIKLKPRKNDLGNSIHDGDSLKCKINELSGEFDFQVPEEPLFYSFFKLDDPDFLDTYLYLPEFSHMLHFPHSSLKSVKNVAGGLTRIFKIPLLGIYEGQRWRLPRLQLYEDGSLSRMSKGFVGENEYDQEWLDTYFERVTENFGKSIDEYLKMISKEPRKKLSKS